MGVNLEFESNIQTYKHTNIQRIPRVSRDPIGSNNERNTYGSKGRGWILCRIVSLFFQLRSLNTPIQKQIQSKVKHCSALFRQ